MPKTNTMPVVMYPEGIVVGKVRSGRTRPAGPVRHVAFDATGGRAGTFDTFSAARDVLVHRARGTCPDQCPICRVDLKSDGYPIGHKTDEGNPCAFTWARL